MGKSVKLKVTLSLIIPRMPNFIRTKDGDKPIDIGELDGDAFDTFLEGYNQKFIEHYVERRKLFLRGAKSEKGASV